MTKAIWNYQGDKRSLASDALFLVHLRALNVAAGDRAISSTHPALAESMVIPMPGAGHLSERTNRASMRRLIDSGLILVDAGEGRAPNTYYVPECGLERVTYALRYSLNDDQMYAPIWSPVCLVDEPPCQCREMLFAAQLGIPIYLHRSITPIHLRRGDRVIWRRRGAPRITRAMDSAFRFIKRLRGIDLLVRPLDVWKIPSVEHILSEIKRAGL